MCLFPIFVRDRMQYVPCGKCHQCITAQSQTWIYRCKYELSKSDLGLFVTLTYDNNHLPFVPLVDENTGEYHCTAGFDKKQLQLFFKRFRKELDPLGIRFRYLLVSEYGGKTDRPHYHGLFFFRNVPDEWNIVMKIEDIIDKQWIYGNVNFGDIEESSIAYCCKYVLKDKEPPPNSMKPFVLYSRNPGIGMEYVEDNKDWHRGEYDKQYFKPLEGNIKIPLSYYIKSKLYNLKEGSYDRLQLDIRKKQHDMQKYALLHMYDSADYLGQYSNVSDCIALFRNNEFFEKLKYRKLKEKL